MKQYGKLTKGTLTHAPARRIEHNGYITINPTPEQLAEAGFYEVVASQPEDREGYTAKATWKKVKGKIVQVWEYTATDK